MIQNAFRYATGNPSVRFAHQPNFLPSVNVVGQAATLSHLAELLGPNTTQLCLLIDYDVNTDRRYRTSMLPSLLAQKGYHSLSVPAVHRKDECLMFGEPGLGTDFVSRTMELLHSHVTQDISFVRQLCGATTLNRSDLRRRESEIEHHLLAAFDAGRTLAEANAIFLSRLVNVVLGLPTLFIPGSRALRLLSEHVSYLWEKSSQLSRVCSEVAEELEKSGLIVGSGLVPDEDVTPFWVSCPNDARRIVMSWADRGRKKAVGICDRCNYRAVVTPRTANLLQQDSDCPIIIPRIIWDDLLDGFAWGHVAGCGYSGGLEHYIFTACVASRLGLRSLPEFFSQCSRPIQPESDFEYAAKRAETMSNHLPQAAAGIQSAMELQLRGRGSFIHSMLWREQVDAQDLILSFSSELN